MEVKNHLRPNKAQMEGFFEGDTETEITMLNLLKFKEKAEYGMEERQISPEERPILSMGKKLLSTWKKLVENRSLQEK